MKILITGSEGFIGQSLIDNWSNRHEISVIDRFIGNDILTMSTHDLENYVSQCDIVYHLASPVGIHLIDQNSQSFLSDMMKMNLRIFDVVKKFNKKIVFFSTSEVYKDCVDAKETDNLVVGTPDTPRWGYASGKLTSEFLCKAMCDRCVIIRPFNICGPLDRKGVLFSIINQIKNKGTIVIHGDGKQTRSLCDIRDLLAFLDVINDLEFDGQIYNIGNNNNNISVLALACLCKNISKSDSNIVHVNYSESFSETHKDIQYRNPNCEKMNSLYQSRYTIEEIIKSML